MTRKIRTYRKAMSVFRVFIVGSIIFSFLFCKSAIAQDRIIYLHPTAGGPMFSLEDPDSFDEFWQLIPIFDEKDEEKVTTYLAEILRGEEQKILGDMTILDAIVGFIKLDDDHTDYIFISPKSNEVIYKDPYMNDESGPVCFDVEKIPWEENTFVSVFYFRRKEDEDFNVIFNIYEALIVWGKDALLPKSFKKGEPCSTDCYPFRINACGEMYVASYFQRTTKGEEKSESVGFISYTDSIEIRLGTKIGFEYELIDSTLEGKYKVNIIHPEYKFGPEKGQTNCTDEKENKFGKLYHIIWEFTEEYELIPSEWIIQLLDEDKILYEKKFYLLLDKTK